MKMNTSEHGKDIIKEHEAFRSKPYYCSSGVATIGYGNTYYADGRKVRITDAPITREEAESLFDIVLCVYEDIVRDHVTAELTQNQFDALVSFVYNIGEGNFSKSTILKKINANPNDAKIAYEFSRWNKSGGKVSRGLSSRRKQEADLYFKP